MDKLASVERLPPPILAKSPKEVKEISKFFKANNSIYRNKNTRKSYAQAFQLTNSTSEVLKIKETFLNFQANKIKNIQKIIKDNSKPKHKIKITTKGPSRKHVIVSISNENKMKFMEDSSTHITNINRVLKGIKLEVMANFVCSDQAGITIAMNKVTSSLDLQTIENYVKNMNYIEADSVEVLWLSQSKSYLKIIGILYFAENTNTPITADVVEAIIKKNHIFNNIALASRSWVIKVSPKSDMAII